jgi:predicted secreted hydrolase
MACASGKEHERIEGMKKIQYTTTTGIPPRSMEEEFLCHQKGAEWWYSTGYLNDESGKLYTFQFTLAKLKVFGIKLHILMTAVTDFQTKKHYYSQQSIFFDKNIMITPDCIGVDGTAEMTFSKKKVRLDMSGKDYSLHLDLDVFKPAAWHCENGVLRMGIDEPNQKTYYWSYTNLPATGKLMLEGKEFKVSGKGWFDRQGGPYNPLDERTSWEWFSLRFFDNEEIMLFSFPQDPYQDGTFIDKLGKYRRLNDYTITPLGWIEVSGKKFSSGWNLEMKGVKDEVYTIKPVIDGQLNMFYFEELAEIKDRADNSVGYCFVELLPGVYNKTNPLYAFQRTK